MKKIFGRKILAFILCGAMAAGLASCSKTNAGNNENNAAAQNKQQQQQEMPEYVYVAEFSEISGESSMRSSQVLDGYLYTQEWVYDEITGDGGYALKRYPLTENGLGEAEEAFKLPETEGNANVDNFALDASGNKYFLTEVYPALEEGEEMPDDYWEKRTYHLNKYDSQGNSVYDMDITDIIRGSDDNNSWVQGMAVDGEGRVCLAFSSIVRYFDTEGKPAGEASIGTGWIQSIGTGKDGKVYLVYYNGGAGGGTVLAQADIAGRGIGAPYDNYPRNGGQPCMIDEKTFVISDGTSAYSYSLDTKTSEKLFDWVESDINGNYVEKIEALEDGRLLVIIRDWETNVNEIALLTKTPSSQVVQKETITIGVLYDSQSLRSDIVAFNKSSNSYRIKQISYIDNTAEWTENTYSDAIAAMNNAITSDNCPDILALSGLDVESLAEKGVFEDLFSYLEKSSELDRADYYENLLDSMTYDGKLVGIPSSFTLQTIVGKTADVGPDKGWNLQDIMELAKAHPDAELLDYATREYILSFMLSMSQKQFVDDGNGQCSFDSQEFKDLLAFAASFPPEEEYQYNRRPAAYRIADGNLLLYSAYISGFRDIQMIKAVFNDEPITFKGYPNAEKQGGALMNVYDTYAIASKSDKKDAAWEFIEGILTKEPEDNMYDWGFPARKSQFAKLREDATKIEYIINEETGEPYLDEDSEPIIKNSGGSVGYSGEDGEEWWYEYHITTEEEADILEELMRSAISQTSYMDTQITNIIQEEAAPYFNGQKSVDEVVNIIQSRVSLYVKENQ